MSRYDFPPPPTAYVDHLDAHSPTNLRVTHWWSTKRWRRRRPRLTVHQGAPYWSRPFSVTMPSSALPHQALERVEVVEIEVPVHVEKTSYIIALYSGPAPRMRSELPCICARCLPSEYSMKSNPFHRRGYIPAGALGSVFTIAQC